MRVSVLNAMTDIPATAPMLPSMTAPTGFSSLVGDEDSFMPMNSFIEGNLLSIRRMTNGQLLQRTNAGISTPSGAWIWQDWNPLINLFVQASNRWTLAGVTRDSAGAPLGTCVVHVSRDRSACRYVITSKDFRFSGQSKPDALERSYFDGGRNHF